MRQYHASTHFETHYPVTMFREAEVQRENIRRPGMRILYNKANIILYQISNWIL